MAVYNYIESTGVIIPDTAEIIEDVEAEYRQVFGADFVTDPETQGGAMVSAEVTSRQSVVRNNALLGNQIHPAQSGGTFFDAIWSLTGGQRASQTRSTVQLVCNGVAGTSVPIGSRVTDTLSQVWRSSVAFVIPASGTITVSFTSENFGAIFASINTITTITDGTLGWETVNNESAAVPGVATQSDLSAKQSRNEQLALQGRSTAVAVVANLSAVDGVRSFSFRENVEGTMQVIDGITLVQNSIWAAVDGGTDENVAGVLLEAKSGGSNWNGATSVQVLEPASGQTFTVLFDRPTTVDVRVRLTVRSGLSSDPSNQIIDSVINYANGLSVVGRGFVTGNDVSPYEIGAAVNTDMPSAFVTNVELAENVQSPVYSPATLAIALNQIAAVSRGNIEVIFI